MRTSEALRSDPIMCTSRVARTLRYLPLPQPTSRPTDPGATRVERNDAMNGHGLYRVELKCPAIDSYTLCTCSCSYVSGDCAAASRTGFSLVLVSVVPTG